MRNYISIFVVRWIQHVYSGGVEIYSGPATAAGADRDDLYTQTQAQDTFMMISLGGDSFSDDFPNDPRQVFVCFDKETVMRMLQNVDHSGTSVAVYLWDAITVEPSQQIIRNTLRSPRGSGWTDSAGVRRKPAPSEAKAGAGEGQVAPTTIEGIFIIVRSGLYFAGFEGGTGDPVFVRFLFGATSAHLYLTEQQASTDAARIRKLFNRPDIPVDVVEI